MFGHTVVQLPQWFTSLAVCVSHPSRLEFSLALQSLHPALHAMLHTLDAQLGVPFAALHGCPHPPQWLRLLSMFVSHPAAAVQSP